MREKYLPIGTVCMLKNARKKVMIIGFCAISESKEKKIYDYIGCVYPEGLLTMEQALLFDHEKIHEICFMGFENNEEKEFKVKVKEIISEIENSNEEVELLEETQETIGYDNMDVPTATIIVE